MKLKIFPITLSLAVLDVFVFSQKVFLSILNSPCAICQNLPGEFEWLVEVADFRSLWRVGGPFRGDRVWAWGSLWSVNKKGSPDLDMMSLEEFWPRSIHGESEALRLRNLVNIVSPVKTNVSVGQVSKFLF